MSCSATPVGRPLVYHMQQMQCIQYYLMNYSKITQVIIKWDLRSSYYIKLHSHGTKLPGQKFLGAYVPGNESFNECEFPADLFLRTSTSESSKVLLELLLSEANWLRSEKTPCQQQYYRLFVVATYRLIILVFLPCDCKAYARYCCRDSVCPSVRPSVRVYCDKTKQ